MWRRTRDELSLVSDDIREFVGIHVEVVRMVVWFGWPVCYTLVSLEECLCDMLLYPEQATCETQLLLVLEVELLRYTDMAMVSIYENAHTFSGYRRFSYDS